MPEQDFHSQRRYHDCATAMSCLWSSALRRAGHPGFVDLKAFNFTLPQAVALASRIIVKYVLFVCTGNICRSPMALGLFRRLLGNRKEIESDAAGVHAVRGQPPSVHAIDVRRSAGSTSRTSAASLSRPRWSSARRTFLP